MKMRSYELNYAHRRRCLWLLFLVGLALIAIVANATTLVHLSFQQLVGYSSAIARVRCLGADVRMVNGEIWTDTSFHLVEIEKGNLPEYFTVRQTGGTFHHLHSRVDGSPEFQRGEEAFIFLIGNADNRFHIVGWTQGTFRIFRDPRTGIETVSQDSAAIPAYNPESRMFEKMGLKNMRSDLFVQRIRQQALRRFGTGLNID